MSQHRDTQGRYDFGKRSTRCLCGHTFGEHTAAKVNGKHECIADGCDDCGCVGFKAVRP